MENLYNVLDKEPVLEKWQMPYELERLAGNLVESGLFRIDANERMNFVRFSRPSDGINVVFSYRELCDPNLIPRTRHIMKKLLCARYKGNALKEKVHSEFVRLQNEVQKILGVGARVEMRLARAIVQACHPSVMMLLLAEGAELFISYSHTVGDMLDIQSWQSHGDSGGLQSTGHMENAVFVSCGGNPFATEENREYLTDGADALARMIIIGGQELGHFADIIRDKNGRKRSRHSANFSATKPKKSVRVGRINDIRNVDEIKERLEKAGLEKVSYQEKHIRFYKKQKIKGLVVINRQRKVNNMTRGLMRRCRRYGIKFITKIPHDKDNYWSSMIEAMLGDMRFNLEPIADAYKRDDPLEQETIACVEALARVPQQVNKWGHYTTRHIMPNLYKIYYKEVIPSCVKAYENITGRKYKFKITKKPILVKYFQKWFYKGI